MELDEIISGLRDLVLDAESKIQPDDPESIFLYDKSVLEAAIDRLQINNAETDETVPAAHWIPCSERMPDAAGCTVIVSAVNTYGQTAAFTAFQGYGDFKWHTSDMDYMNHELNGLEVSDVWTITHWTPLPEPPKGVTA